jgi:hypothetical protein
LKNCLRSATFVGSCVSISAEGAEVRKQTPNFCDGAKRAFTAGR